MPFARSSLQQIIDRIVSDFETRITGATSLLRRSFIKTVARVNGGVFHLIYEYLDYQARQLFITTADTAGLDTHGSEWGILRTGASFATGSGYGTGVATTVVPAGTILIAPDGKSFTVDAESVVDSGGDFTANITATERGEDSNEDSGLVLSFSTPIINIDPSFYVDDGTSGGADEETDDAYRGRILYQKRKPPFGGAEWDYYSWVLENSGVTRAWILPGCQGAGTIGVGFVYDGESSIFPTPTQKLAMKAYIFEHEDPGSGITVGCPVTAQEGIIMLDLSYLPVDFDIRIYPNTAAIRTSITAELNNLVLENGGPGEFLYLSDIDEAIRFGMGQGVHKLRSPFADIDFGNTLIPKVGNITFSNY